VQFLDILGKIAPIVAAVIALIGVILAARGIGLRYRQEHTVDFGDETVSFLGFLL